MEPGPEINRTMLSAVRFRYSAVYGSQYRHVSDDAANASDLTEMTLLESYNFLSLPPLSIIRP